MKVFASAIGQWDNVGDTVLRRGYLDALRRAGTLHVYVGDQTQDQLGALGVGPDDVLLRSSAQWRSALSSRIGREAVIYGFDTGETELRRRFAQRYLRLAPLLAANRALGGHAVHVGVGVRESTAWRVPVRAALQVVDLVSWRDERSRAVVGHGTVTPDWAFALGSPHEVLAGSTERPVLAVAVRASLPHSPRTEPDRAWVDRVAGIAAAAGLAPVFVAQIGRDGPLAERLAAQAGASSLVWESGDHAAFEERLRTLYRRAAGVVSDRLHGLVIGATEGAVPIALASGPEDKTTRTLAAVRLRQVAVPPTLVDAEGAVLDALSRRNEVVTAVRDARSRLDVLGADIARLGGRR